MYCTTHIIYICILYCIYSLRMFTLLTVGGNMGEIFLLSSFCCLSVHTPVGALWPFLLKECLYFKKDPNFSATKRHIQRHTASPCLSLSWSNLSQNQYDKGQRYSNHSQACSLCLLYCVSQKPKTLPLWNYINETRAQFC